MNKIVIITGAPLTGKTTYIKSLSLDTSKFYHLDIPLTFLELFNLVDTENEEHLLSVYNHISSQLFDLCFIEGHDLIFEFCTGFEQTDILLTKLIETIKSMNLRVELKHMDCTEKEALKRNADVKNQVNYYSSYFFNQDTYEILNNFLEDYRLNSQLK